ncbi:hypothetical protein LO767_00575 [Halopseudomonas aestusnigri]|uniref:hypothetical protein n=1 Tax=Halopseudomonas aestusnigri TaxID=857252 RepID=UPI001E49D693|nr:hypothetical protein [Halopseudomonas aestusnigri]UGV31049.1 hypothetical protein LO767_00575 [Halopseudomonas aestusnigri]
MNKAILLMACGLVMAGCAGTPAVSPTKTDKAGSDSLALQVMKANGYSAGLKDAEVGLEATPSSGSLTADTLNALLLREHLLGRATPLPGVPNSAMSAFFVLELFNDQTYLPRHGMWMPVWMPQSLARDALDAQQKLTAIIEQAVAESLPADYRTKPYEWSNKAVFGAESSYRMLRVDGPLCEDWSCVIRGSLSSSERPTKSFDAKMVRVDTPPFISDGDGSSYRLRGLGGVVLHKVTEEYDEKGAVSGHWHRVKTEPLSGFDHAAFYRRLSTALPEWAFIYLGPEYAHNQAGIPLVLNRGQELLFVKPTPKP